MENVSAVIPKCKEKFFSKHVRNFGFAKSRAKHDYVSTCLRASTWFTCQHACMLVRFMCQRGCVPTCQKCANFSFLHFNVLCCVPVFQLSVPTCKTACQVFKHSSYESLREISILYYHKECIRLHFCTSFHNKGKCVEVFFFIIFFFFSYLGKAKIHLGDTLRITKGMRLTMRLK